MVPSQKNTPPVSQYTSRRRLIQTGPLKCPASLSEQCLCQACDEAICPRSPREPRLPDQGAFSWNVSIHRSWTSSGL